MNLEKAKELTQNLFRETVKRGMWKIYSHQELMKKLEEAGYTDKETEQILEKHAEEVITPYFEEIEDVDQNNETTISYLTTSEDELIEHYHKKLEPKIERRWKMEAKDYVLQDIADEKDETEHKIREIYATKNVKKLRETDLLQEMKKRGNSENETQNIIENYTKKHILEPDIEVEKIPAYRYPWTAVYNHLKIEPKGQKKIIKEIYDETKTDRLKKTELIEQLAKRKYTKEQAEQIIKKLEQENTISYSPIEVKHKAYTITHPDEWRYEEYQEYLQMRYCESDYQEGIQQTNATWKIKFKDIREIIEQEEKKGKKYVKHIELVRKLAEKCETTKEEAERALETAELLFKIETKPNQTKEEEKEYWWRGIADYYPVDLINLED